MYGTPAEALEPLQTLTLDLPSGVSWVEDPATGSSALYLVGPLQAGVDLGNLPRLLPATRSFTAGRPLVSFHFAAPIPPGTYQVVVHQSRIKDMTGASMVLTFPDEAGVVRDWTGWTLTVLRDARAIPLAPPEEPLVITQRTPPPTVIAATAGVVVKLDDTPVVSGMYGLSGEVLTVETVTPGHVELEIEYLIRGQSTSLYELFLERHHDAPESAAHRTHFTAVGPIFDYTWAAYHGNRTDGTLPVDDGGRLLIATPTIGSPKAPAQAPLLTRSVVEADVPAAGHPNTYDVVTYTVTPSRATAPAYYQSRTLIFPNTLVDEANTPATNPRLYPGAAYLPLNATPGEDDAVAIYDLPLAARLRITIDGQEVWWGQTRMLPLLVPPSRYYSLTGSRMRSPAERSELEANLWRASTEALTLWACALPASVPPTMEEYVLARLAGGWGLEDGMQGLVTVRLGDHEVSGISDHGLRRRVVALADLLARCQPTAPLFPDDAVTSGIARLASKASPSMYPEPYGTAVFSWESLLHLPTVISLRRLQDPMEYSRRNIQRGGL